MQNHVLRCLSCILLFVLSLQVSAAPVDFNPGWKLIVGDPPQAAESDFDDASWKLVTLPHAWNEDDAFKKDIADLSTGIAWYRKHFILPPSAKGKKIFLE